MSPAKQRSQNDTQSDISDIMLGIPTPGAALHDYGVLVDQYVAG